MSILDRKMRRDVWSLRGQIVTIALLVAAGVAVLVGSTSSYVSLLSAQETHYAAARFGDIWADVKRMPEGLVARVAEIPGIAAIDGRIVADVRLDWPRSAIPVSGRIISVPAPGQPALNRLHLVEGRWLDPLRHDEVIVNVAFAQEWSLRSGERITVILNGRRQAFTVAGVAHSPEYVFATRPGSPLPDDRSFVVLWSSAEAIATATDMEGAVNNLVLSLAPRAPSAAVIAALDRMLEPYGTPGAYARADQASHRFLSDELAEQRTLAVTVPLVFFAVAAFLLNIVLGRLIEAQREQIAALKALGYPSTPIALHYLKLVAVICVIGTLAGIGLGAWYGKSMMESYGPFFRFPDLRYVLPVWLPFAAAAISFAAALAGTLSAIRRVLRLPPAVAMRPPTPARTAGLLMHRWAGAARSASSTKMAWRSIAGRPLRTAFTVLGIALALPMVVLGLFWWDALRTMTDIHFDRIDRSDAIVAFTEAVEQRALHALTPIPGVLRVEGQRIVSARLHAGHRSYRVGLTGLQRDPVLIRPLDRSLRPVQPPPDGILISRQLAEILRVQPGDRLTVEILEGSRPTRALPLAGLVDDILGIGAYLDREALNRLMGEDDRVSHAALSIDPQRAAEVWRQLSLSPRVASITVKRALLQIFTEKVAGLVLVGAVVLTLFGLIIAVGIVYNSARIAFQERGWELASLRILGFRRSEVTAILLAELALEMIVAVPLGILLAQGLVEALVAARSNESFRIPAVISAATFATAALVVIAAGAGSAWMIRRRVDRLDLVAALKTRD